MADFFITELEKSIIQSFVHGFQPDFDYINKKLNSNAYKKTYFNINCHLYDNI